MKLSSLFFGKSSAMRETLNARDTIDADSEAATRKNKKPALLRRVHVSNHFWDLGVPITSSQAYRESESRFSRRNGTRRSRRSGRLERPFKPGISGGPSKSQSCRSSPRGIGVARQGNRPRLVWAYLPSGAR